MRVEGTGVVCGYGVDMLLVSFFAARGEDLVVGEDVILGVAADPGTRRLWLDRRVLRQAKVGVDTVFG